MICPLQFGIKMIFKKSEQNKNCYSGQTWFGLVVFDDLYRSTGSDRRRRRLNRSLRRFSSLTTTTTESTWRFGSRKTSFTVAVSTDETNHIKQSTTGSPQIFYPSNINNLILEDDLTENVEPKINRPDIVKGAEIAGRRFVVAPGSHKLPVVEVDRRPTRSGRRKSDLPTLRITLSPFCEADSVTGEDPDKHLRPDVVRQVIRTYTVLNSRGPDRDG